MRKAEGKEFGYIILPVAVPAGITPEEALNDNERFQVVWQVLQAIRAHDERFDNTVNSIEYNNSAPENIIVDVVNLTKPKKEGVFEGSAGGDGGDGVDSGAGGNGVDSGSGGDGAAGSGGSVDIQGALPFPISDWKDAVYAKIVKKVGTREYWDDWSADIADIASRYINLIENLLEDTENQDAFNAFVDSLQVTLNPPDEGADSAVLNQVSEGPRDPPELLVNGILLFPIEFHWVSRGQLHTADAPPTSEDIRSVKRAEEADELLIRMNETVPPYHTLVRECERINDTETVELEGCTYLEYGAQFQVDWKKINSGLELVVPISEKSKYVTVTIQYPNANGWDRTTEGNPVNHANYAFVFTES